MTAATVLADLKRQVGSETFVGDWITVDQDRVNRFAEATGDHQWIHVDVERAQRESPYGAPIAHGFLTLSMLPVLTAGGGKAPTYPGVKLTVNYGLNRVRFPSPVKVGSRIRVKSLLSSAELKGNAVQQTRTMTVEIEGEEKPALIAEWLGMVFKAQ